MEQAERTETVINEDGDRSPLDESVEFVKETPPKPASPTFSTFPPARTNNPWNSFTRHTKYDVNLPKNENPKGKKKKKPEVVDMDSYDSEEKASSSDSEKYGNANHDAYSNSEGEETIEKHTGKRYTNDYDSGSNSDVDDLYGDSKLGDRKRTVVIDSDDDDIRFERESFPTTTTTTTTTTSTTTGTYSDDDATDDDDVFVQPRLTNNNNNNHSNHNNNNSKAPTRAPTVSPRQPNQKNSRPRLRPYSYKQRHS